MKRDEELYKIQCAMSALSKFESKMYALGLGDKGDERARKYIVSRYKYFFEWLLDIDNK